MWASLCIHPHTPKNTPPPSLRDTSPFSAALEVKAPYINFSQHDCQHSAAIYIVKPDCSEEGKTQPPPLLHLSPPLTLSSYLLGSALENVFVISQWFLHLEGRGCQAPVSLAAHIFLTPALPHSSLLPPASPVIQISLLSAHISEAPQFACQLA